MTSEEIENVTGAEGGDFIQAYAAGIALMTGMITGNPVRVTLSSFGVGYHLANGFGADELGSALGIWIYDAFHEC